MASPDPRSSAALLQRLLSDSELRARFRADPRSVLAEEELNALADELGSTGDPMQTLQPRESRSSLAGAAVAAAVEALALVDPSGHLVDAASASGGSAAHAGHRSASLSDLPDSDDEGDDGEDAVSGSDDSQDESSDDSDDEDEGDDESEDDEDADQPDALDESQDSNDGSPGDDTGGDDEQQTDAPGPADSAGSFDLQVPGEYPGDAAPRPAIAAWMAQEARKRGIPAELPVMAALTESGMRNLSYGDADSVGFFQMRLSVWDKGPYAGFGKDPQRQLDWFLDAAERVRSVRQQRGQSVTDPRQFGDWIADIERPAEQYRGRYQTHLHEAHALLRQAEQRQGQRGGQSGAEHLADAADGVGREPGRKALAALSAARSQLGTPYLWGGSSPSTGFDCSGLVQWAYARVGISIPRTTYLQIDAPNGRAVGRNDLLPGDLVFFQDASNGVHHVGISLGGDRFLHAPHTGDVVKVSSLDEPYYAREFAGGRRFVDPARGAAAAAAAQNDAVPAPQAAEDRVDARAVKLAMDALERDRLEIARPGTQLFHQLMRQEQGKGGNAARFLPAVQSRDH